MKRMIITAVSVVAATAAFAAPASAQSVQVADPSLTLWQPCQPGEKLDTCLIRIARNAPDTAFDLAEAALYTAGDALGDTIDTVEAACERYLSGCAAVPTP